MCGGAGKVSIPEIGQQGEGWGEVSETNTCKCRVRSAPVFISNFEILFIVDIFALISIFKILY